MWPFWTGLCALMVLAGPAGAQGEEPAPAGQPPGPPSCTTECHKDKLSHRVVHGPVKQDCRLCHVQGSPDEHKFFLITPKETLCLRCHALPHLGTDHAPVREGKCLECHDPHGSDQKRMLLADPKRDLCMKCHKKNFSGSAFVHGPVALGACVVCHEPHSSAEPKLLNQPLRTLCQKCHPEVVPGEGSDRHVHGALALGCTKCHDPHASEHKFQLHEEAPQLCLSCHLEQMRQVTAGAKVVHGALTQVGGCTRCHEPHSSQLPSLQRASQPATCLVCHDRAIKMEDGRELANMSQLLEQNKDHHGPIREGVCTACHHAHTGDHFRLLVEDYPPQFYAPFKLDTFKLCFRCHQPDLVLKPKGMGLTQFRDGDRNLHYVHVNREKGRTCRACHEVHASKRPAHIREAVPFGSLGWMLEINFQSDQQGGSCTPACHTTRSYNRTIPASVPKAVSQLQGVPP